MTAEEWKEAFEERAAIMQYDGGLTRAQAERAARRCMADMGARQFSPQRAGR